MRLKIKIHGYVQGVGFRYFVKRIADSHQLMGWVRNLDDGTVEALFIGDKVDIESVVEMCRRGPHSAEVERIEMVPDDESILPDDFLILY